MFQGLEVEKQAMLSPSKHEPHYTWSEGRSPFDKLRVATTTHIPDNRKAPRNTQDRIDTEVQGF